MLASSASHQLRRAIGLFALSTGAVSDIGFPGLLAVLFVGLWLLTLAFYLLFAALRWITSSAWLAFAVTLALALVSCATNLEDEIGFLPN